MPVGHIWGWPSQSASSDQTLAAMTALGRLLAERAGDCQAVGHPLEITHELAAGYAQAADEITAAAGIERMPRLAQLVSASQFWRRRAGSGRVWAMNGIHDHAKLRKVIFNR